MRVGLMGPLDYTSKHYLEIFLFLLAFINLPRLAIWKWRQRNLEAKVGRVWRSIRAEWQTRDTYLIKQAKKRAKYLCSLIPENYWSKMRGQIQVVAANYLPNLLEEKKKIVLAIQKIKVIMAKYSKDKELSNFARNLIKKTTDDLHSLQARMRENEQAIQDSLDFLEHIESDLLTAQLSGTGVAELRAHFQELLETVEDQRRVQKLLDEDLNRDLLAEEIEGLGGAEEKIVSIDRKADK
ncbi:MAG: hypothetical protein GF349_04970 [Candidatus Magasanikbacteria bacterium]|nr:hypothetical protein [Candidatus Magasanikbacteria bacterium]